jgi:peptide-methionine (S)-S-oxide reductase
MPATETATLAGGCFWCLEAVYEGLQGVLSVSSGYMGGHTEDPSYKDVCTGTTGHQEVVQITFDRDTVSYFDILQVFFAIHDPTTQDRQGDDFGPQYRSVIFYHSDAQRAAAEEMIQILDNAAAWSAPIVTEVRPAGRFYRAEGYHQQYFQHNPQQPYCSYVVGPKIRKFREKFESRLKPGF